MRVNTLELIEGLLLPAITMETMISHYLLRCHVHAFFSFVFSVVSQGHIRRFGGMRDKKEKYCEAGMLCHDLFNMGGFPVKGNTSSRCVRLPRVVHASE